MAAGGDCAASSRASIRFSSPSGSAASARGRAIKALWVVHYPNFGGPHNRVLRLHEALERRGWTVAIALPDEPGTGAARLREGGVETLVLPLARLRADPRFLLRFIRDFRPTVRALEEAIEQTQADVVVVAGLVNPHAAIAARRQGKPVVWQIIDSMAPPPLRRLAMRLVRRYADAVMFGGETLIDLHGGRAKLAAPVFVARPSVDTDRFVPSPERRAATRAQLGIPAEAQVVGTVAALTPMKGVENFLAAAQRIAAARPDTWFVVVGGAPASHRPYGEQLRRHAAELALPHPIVFAGERADVENWYPAFDLDLITSLPRSEGTTTTGMEAQACGVPVVAARIGAVAEVVDDGKTGLLVEPERPDLLADAVLRLLADDALRIRLGKAGREAAAQRFGIEAAADLQVEIYEAALGKAR